MDNQTDTRTITIEIREHGNLQIDGTITIPTFAYTTELFDIVYQVVNNGGDDNFYCSVLEGTNELDRQVMQINAGETRAITHTVNIPTVGNYTLIIDIGYLS